MPEEAVAIPPSIIEQLGADNVRLLIILVAVFVAAILIGIFFLIKNNKRGFEFDLKNKIFKTGDGSDSKLSLQEILDLGKQQAATEEMYKRLKITKQEIVIEEYELGFCYLLSGHGSYHDDVAIEKVWTRWEKALKKIAAFNHIEEKFTVNFSPNGVEKDAVKSGYLDKHCDSLLQILSAVRQIVPNNAVLPKPSEIERPLREKFTALLFELRLKAREVDIDLKKDVDRFNVLVNIAGGGENEQ